MSEDGAERLTRLTLEIAAIKQEKKDANRAWNEDLRELTKQAVKLAESMKK